MAPANYVAYTAPINPAGASVQLTLDHIWPLLERKIRAAEDFVGGTIASTDVLSRSTTAAGQPVTVREIVFHVGNRRVREECVEYWPMKVEFRQPDGTKVQNIISTGAAGELYMTYAFEWIHPELEGDEPALAAKLVQETATARISVESTLVAMRQMVADGRWKETA